MTVPEPRREARPHIAGVSQLVPLALPRSAFGQRGALHGTRHTAVSWGYVGAR